MVNKRDNIPFTVINAWLLQKCEQKKEELLQCHVPCTPLKAHASFLFIQYCTLRGLEEIIATNTKHLILREGQEHNSTSQSSLMIL